MEWILFLIYASVYLGLVSTTFYILGFRSEQSKKKLLFTDDELPNVSVIIPAWNEQKSIARTLDSILASNYPKEKLEIIVVDDGSKDKTYEIAKKYQSDQIKVYTKQNGGKGTALNFGIEKSHGDFIFTMDADTFVEPQCVREMTRYFKNPQVMCVAPSMLVHKPKGILQRVQQAEYLFGLFIRKAFTSINAAHVTPGAFSAYRKTFFDKHGGYDEGNITEDLEMALKIQYHGYTIEYSPESAVYTLPPNKFKALMVQRRRWYTGLMKNTWKYKKLIGPKYGDMGLFVIPIAWLSILFSVIVINYSIIKIILEAHKNIVFLTKINFDFTSIYSMNNYILEKIIFGFFSNTVLIFTLFFLVVLTIYINYATNKTGKVKGLYGSIVIYFFFFALLFGFWWTVSIIYIMLNKKVKWR